MVRMFVYRVGVDPRGRVLLILADEDVTRLLPMVIGQYEARAIAMGLAKEYFPRPLTHDLLHSVISSLGHRLERIEVTKLENEVFYAELNLVGDEDIVKVDSRPSDAIALAVRADAPIYVSEDVLDQAGVLPEALHIEGEEEERVDDEESGPELAPEDMPKIRRLLEDLDIDDDSEQ